MSDRCASSDSVWPPCVVFMPVGRVKTFPPYLARRWPAISSLTEEVLEVCQGPVMPAGDPLCSLHVPNASIAGVS